MAKHPSDEQEAGSGSSQSSTCECAKYASSTSCCGVSIGRENFNDRSEVRSTASPAFASDGASASFNGVELHPASNAKVRPANTNFFIDLPFH